MATGVTTTGSFSNALPYVIANVRLVREEASVYARVTEFRKLKKGTGLDWLEFGIRQLTAQDITETTLNENPQRYSGFVQKGTPRMTQIMVKVTDRTYEKVPQMVTSRLGQLAGNAMERKKDEDYLNLLNTMLPSCEPGSGQPLSHSHISAAVSRIQTNAIEPTNSVINAVLHGFQIKDLKDEIIAGVGTFNVPNGLTEEFYRKGFEGSVAGANVYRAGNLRPDSVPNVTGAVHAREAVVAIQGAAIKTETRRDPAYGGGADEIFITDDYAFIERETDGVQIWGYRMRSDATAPTS